MARTNLLQLVFRKIEIVTVEYLIYHDGKGEKKS